MSVLVGIHSISKSFGTQTLFKDISFSICEGECIGLIGPNGAGKTSLLKILVGLDHPDAGQISSRKNVRIGYASQSPTFPDKTIEEILTEGIPELQTKARILLGKVQFTDFSLKPSALSGGWKKRLDIARALMQEPDLLILDEPTNHLDLEGILWLEKFLKRERFSYLIVSHDRYFLENVCTRVIELNKCYPQGLFMSNGGMQKFYENKESFLAAQEKYERDLNSYLKDEIAWMKRSPKARTTKSTARVNKTLRLMDELTEVKSRNQVKRVEIEFSESNRETRKLLVAKNLTKSLGSKLLFKGIDLVLSPGSRLGIVGQNGTGKTTFLRVLAGLIPQDMGTVKQADGLRIIYFDQHREQIPPHLTLKEALSPHSDFVDYRGRKIHVNGWAKRFLFTEDRMFLPVENLSGGERARIQIARLMLEPADVLFLDEPTNDLDIPTLEVIEESLAEFEGAVVLISHDRCLMDRICKQLLAFETGKEGQFFADYSQYENSKQPPVPKKTTMDQKPKSKRLSYNERKELEGMEAKILEIEQEINVLSQKAATPEDYTFLAEKQHQLEKLFERWQFLENQ